MSAHSGRADSQKICDLEIVGRKPLPASPSPGKITGFGRGDPAGMQIKPGNEAPYTDVVSRKCVRAMQSPQDRELRGSPPDTANLRELSDDRLGIRVRPKVLQIQRPGEDIPRYATDVFTFPARQAAGPEGSV